jgi:hypothetical protein
LWGWPGNVMLPISAFQIARIYRCELLVSTWCFVF